jgi:hypothetical protein
MFSPCARYLTKQQTPLHMPRPLHLAFHPLCPMRMCRITRPASFLPQVYQSNVNSTQFPTKPDSLNLYQPPRVQATMHLTPTTSILLKFLLLLAILTAVGSASPLPSSVLAFNVNTNVTIAASAAPFIPPTFSDPLSAPPRPLHAKSAISSGMSA